MTPVDAAVSSAVRGLVRDGTLDPGRAAAVSEAVSGAVRSWRDGLAEEILGMAREWEEAMGDDDRSFYSLAMRRAADLVSGTSALDALPVLERPDTPDE